MILKNDFTRVATLDAGSVSISIEKYKREMGNEAQELLDWMADKRERLSNFTLTPDLERKIQEELSGYPRRDFILKGVSLKNPKALSGEVNKLWNWILHEESGRARYSEMRDAVILLMDYNESLGDLGTRYSDQGVEDRLYGVISETQKNMEVVRSLIQEAISRINVWHGYPIVIEAMSHPSDVIRGRFNFEPSTSATIHLGSDRLSPNFSLFMHEGKPVIDDVLDAGDEDFFTSIELQSDYFSIVNELIHPTSTQKGKDLILYTSRPTKDREFFERSKTLPVNIFLTNSFDHALGLASDLAGVEGERDVWKVKVNSRYLTQTLEGPVRYYQVTQPDAPVKSLDLVHMGTKQANRKASILPDTVFLGWKHFVNGINKFVNKFVRGNAKDGIEFVSLFGAPTEDSALVSVYLDGSNSYEFDPEKMIQAVQYFVGEMGVKVVWQGKYPKDNSKWVMKLEDLTVYDPLENHRNIKNRWIKNGLKTGEVIDVRMIGVELEKGLFKLNDFIEGVAYVDSETEQFIQSIGKDLDTEEILAATDGRFYNNPDYECIYLH